LIEFKPENIESMRDRVCDALIDFYSDDNDPIQNQDNVFDFDDYLRIVISREEIDGECCFHVQALSGINQYRFWEEGEWNGDPQIIFVSVMNRLYRMGFIDLIWDDWNLSWITEEGVLHLIIRENKEDIDEVRKKSVNGGKDE